MAAYTFEIHARRPIDPQAIRQLYGLAGWWPDRQPADLAFVLAHTVAVGAWDGDHLIGFARAVSDQRFRAYIEDVVVHPTYRRQAVGQGLLTRLLEELQDIETISLFCEPELVPFYERHGFTARRPQVVLHRMRRSDKHTDGTEDSSANTSEH